MSNKPKRRKLTIIERKLKSEESAQADVWRSIHAGVFMSTRVIMPEEG